jgi:hypothetical protein
MALLPLGIWAASGAGGGGGASDFELISTQLVTGSPSSVTFSSIPSTYRHLQVRMTMKNSNGASTMDQGYFTFNGDTTTSNYHAHWMNGNGSGTGNSYSNSYVASIRSVATSLFTASAFSGHILDVYDYGQTTKYKTSRIIGGATNTTYSAYDTSFSSQLWKSTAAITSLTIGAVSGQTFVSGCRFSLYGWN